MATLDLLLESGEEGYGDGSGRGKTSGRSPGLVPLEEFGERRGLSNSAGGRRSLLNPVGEGDDAMMERMAWRDGQPTRGKKKRLSVEIVEEAGGDAPSKGLWRSVMR